MEIEEEKFASSLTRYRDSIEKLMKADIKLSIKSSEHAAKVRKEGNALFCKVSHDLGDHESIFQLYSKSVALAPAGSEELALAYGNRSAFLFHINKYQDCISNVDRALKITNSDVLKVKLLCRKAKCFAVLNFPSRETLLDLIESLLVKIPQDYKKASIKLFNETSSFLLNKSKTVMKDSQPTKVMQNLNRKENNFDSITVMCSEKYGRYLVAARDIEPGEIIWVENFYASCLSLEKMYTNCHHCFATCWSGIPCDNCNWALFCSEKCLEEAMMQYHFIECSVMGYLNNLSVDFFHNIHLGIRTLLLALIETGSIQELRNTVESINKSDIFAQDFINTSQAKIKFATVCKLTSFISDQDFMEFSVTVPNIIVLLVKYTQLFGEEYQLSNIDDLLADQDIIFIGALLRKLINVLLLNAYSLSHLFSKPALAEDNLNISNANSNECPFTNQIGSGLALVSSLVNHSCIPNIRRCFTHDKRIFFYAIRPIERGSQLFDCYYACFSDMTKAERHSYLIKHRFICDCPACVSDWILEEDYFPEEKSKQNEIEISGKLQDLARIIYGGSEYNKSDVLKSLSKAIEQASKYLPPYSSTLCLLCDFLGDVYDEMYGFERNVGKLCRK